MVSTMVSSHLDSSNPGGPFESHRWHRWFYLNFWMLDICWNTIQKGLFILKHQTLRFNFLNMIESTTEYNEANVSPALQGQTWAKTYLLWKLPPCISIIRDWQLTGPMSLICEEYSMNIIVLVCLNIYNCRDEKSNSLKIKICTKKLCQSKTKWECL